MVLLSVKLPDDLAEELGLESQALHTTKGALVREALTLYLRSKKSSLADQIRNMTENLRKNKTSRKELVDWRGLRAKCKIQSDLTPEEEVLVARNRKLPL